MSAILHRPLTFPNGLRQDGYSLAAPVPKIPFPAASRNDALAIMSREQDQGVWRIRSMNRSPFSVAQDSPSPRNRLGDEDSHARCPWDELEELHILERDAARASTAGRRRIGMRV